MELNTFSVAWGGDTLMYGHLVLLGTLKWSSLDLIT